MSPKQRARFTESDAPSREQIDALVQDAIKLFDVIVSKIDGMRVREFVHVLAHRSYQHFSVVLANGGQEIGGGWAVLVRDRADTPEVEALPRDTHALVALVANEAKVIGIPWETASASASGVH